MVLEAEKVTIMLPALDKGPCNMSSHTRRQKFKKQMNEKKQEYMSLSGTPVIPPPLS
jgi:hypothetical protein